MLIISRKVGETFVIGNAITVQVTKIAGDRVSIGIDAPGDVPIRRGELEPYPQGRPPCRDEGSSPPPSADR